MSIPEPPPEFVSRPRLLELLDAAAETATVFAGAGAGFGKTVLLAEWARSRVPGTVAWVSADVGDNDDRLFWSAVLKALHGCTRVPPDSLLRTILVPDEPGRDLAFLAQLADALDALPEPVLLVLDGVQEITAPRTWNGLRALTRHQPAGLRLALSSRREPPLPLVRARLADRLIELGADELRFSVEEAREFLGPAIRPDQVDELIARAEGWPAALRLAIGSAARHGDLRAFFAGRDRALQDYLRDEVLAPLTGAQRELLRAVSIGQDVPPGLAAALADRADAEAILHELAEPATLLVRAGGAPPLYRLPALLRACLHAELARQEPDRLRALHAVAARWFAAHGDPAAALLHCVHSGNAIRVDRLLRRHAVTLFLAGEHHVLRLALAMLDDRLLSAEPLLALVSAALCLETGESGTAGLHLARAEAAWPPAPSAELEVLRQLAYARRAQVDQPPARAVRAADGIDVELARTTELGGLATLHRMSALVAADDRTAAREGLLPVLDAAERRGQDFLVTQCLTQLGTVACRDGDYRVMDTLARRVLTRERTHERQHTLEGAQASALLAYGALLRGEP
ncbi:MAG TPA: LuxR family transcriptional regulator, partial [Amycolatopsis sp.]|nr:LuxR family transcriptional regulator [Amycolatopsis sp.]